MEFDEMQKIWDEQNNRPLYVIDENALHNRVQSKMSTALHIANVTELSLISVYLVAGGILLALNPVKRGANIFMYLETAWLCATVLYVVVSRIKRVRASREFDRSIHGDLDHAISLSRYHIHLSQIMNWNLLPMGAIMIFSGWEAGKLLKVGSLILVSYALAFYAGAKANRRNKRRKRELQILKEKLENGN